MRTITLPDGYELRCKSENTRSGFRHLAYLHKDGVKVAQAKVCYLNRTWERYTFETVIHRVLDNYFKRASIFGAKEIMQQYIELADKDGLHADLAPFRATGMFDALAKLFSEGSDLATRNKMRMTSLKARLPELDLSPLEGLSEEEKAKRLDQVVDMAQAVK